MECHIEALHPKGFGTTPGRQKRYVKRYLTEGKGTENHGEFSTTRGSNKKGQDRSQYDFLKSMSHNFDSRKIRTRRFILTDVVKTVYKPEF